jgi:hypothetical protein
LQKKQGNSKIAPNKTQEIFKDWGIVAWLDSNYSRGSPKSEGLWKIHNKFPNALASWF